MPLWTRTKSPVWEDKEVAAGKVTVEPTDGGHVPYNTCPGWLMEIQSGHHHRELLVCMNPAPLIGFILLEDGFYLLTQDSFNIIWT